jgi:D-arabinose 1-dehydrogenase-like Zn-dependent alcohol dehydrogenase
LKAAVFREVGHPLSIEEVPFPRRESEREAILKVLATGLCHGDVHLVAGEWEGDIIVETPRILGHEIVGELTHDVGGLRKGQKVLVYSSIGCGQCKYCKAGKYQFCERVRVIGYHYDGGFAEYVKVPDFRYLLPVEGNPIELAPLADAGVTAYNATEGIGPSDEVLIIGTGTVALYALQILKRRGAFVSVVGSSIPKLEVASKLGSDEVIQAKRRNYVEKASEKSSRRRFDYVLDFVGADYSLKDALWLLRNEGELRVVGEFGGYVHYPEQLLVLRGLKIRGVLYGSFQDLAEVYRIYREGWLKTLPVPFKLEEINDAINESHEGRIIGRPVIVP